MENADIVLIPYFAELICSEKKPEHVISLQFHALRELQAYLQYYESQGYALKLIMAIGEKKGRMILETTTKGEMDRVLHPGAPHYDGSNFIPDKYCLLEEELIAWSQTSLKGPLTAPAMRRYMELFKQLLPD